jgi:dTDP-L-rhamnose 4-epimerase
MKKHNVLVSGGAGFIGSHLARALLDRGHAVTIMDNFSPQIHGEIPDLTHMPMDAIIRRGNVCNMADWQAALEGKTAVVHLAAETGTGQSMYEIDRYCEVNIGGTAKLLDVLTNHEHNVERLVVASSRAIYGEGRHRCAEHGTVYPRARDEADMATGDFAVKCPQCGCDTEIMATDEDSKIHPSSVYGISKQVQEQLVLTVAAGLGISSVALRYQNVYGPGQSLKNPYTGILSIFSTRLRNGHDLLVFEDGRESRDFVYIDDVVAATVLAVEAPLEAEHGAAPALALNVGSGIRTDVDTVARTLKTALKASGEISVTGNFRIGDIRDNFADLTLARACLGFEPKVDFVTGIARFVDWVQSQDVSVDGFERSIDELKAKGLYR